MGRIPRKYTRLIDRAVDSPLPWDDEAERGAIGAVLLAPHAIAKRLSRRLFEGHFYYEPRGWLWARMSYALCQSKVDWSDIIAVRRWLKHEKLCETCRTKFAIGINDVMRPDGFWWHGDWYCDRVLAAAKCRARVIKAGEDLEAALAQAQRGFEKGRWL